MSDFARPRHERGFEDYDAGAVYVFGPVAVSEAEIVEFARHYDPQAIHTDPAWALIGPYGGLIASGWHTTSLMMRLIVDNYLPTVASLGSPGVDELRWLLPVRPGDQLRVRLTVADIRQSKSKPDRGVLTTNVEVLNQRDETVMSLRAVNLLLSRTALSG